MILTEVLFCVFKCVGLRSGEARKEMGGKKKGKKEGKKIFQGSSGPDLLAWECLRNGL